MTLKEEIMAIVWGTTPKDAGIVADKILSKIEKRIDILWLNGKTSLNNIKEMLQE